MTTLNKDMNRAELMIRDFQIPTLKRMEDFVHVISIAQARKARGRFTRLMRDCN